MPRMLEMPFLSSYLPSFLLILPLTLNFIETPAFIVNSGVSDKSGKNAFKPVRTHQGHIYHFSIRDKSYYYLYYITVYWLQICNLMWLTHHGWAACGII